MFTPADRDATLAFTPSAEFSVWAPVKVAFDRAGAVTRRAEEWQPWSPTPDWRGDAGFAFHDVTHACVAANRGRLWQSLYYLQRIRNRTLALASERHGWDSNEFTRVDDLPPEVREALLPTLVPDLRRETLLPAIELAARAFLDELGRGDPALARRLEPPLRTYITASREDGSGR